MTDCRNGQTLFRKKVVHFVFKHVSTTAIKLDFLAIFSDHYLVITLQVCHTGKILFGIK